MEAERVYAVAALVASLVGMGGFVLLQFTVYPVTGALLLGVGAVLTVAFVAAAVYASLDGPLLSRGNASSASALNTVGRLSAVA